MFHMERHPSKVMVWNASPLGRADRLGLAASFLCALHCALLPVVITLLPSLGVAAGLGDRFEEGFVVFASLLGLFTLASGYRRHRAVRALWLLVPGLVVLWVGVLYAPLHHSLVPHALAMTLGGSLVGLAHLANLRLVHVHTANCGHSVERGHGRL